MANRTDTYAKDIHGRNPQFLIGRIVRNSVYNANYWKEQCFGLNAETLVDKGAELQYVGGTYGGGLKASPFLCLLLKMLQVQPDSDVVEEYLLWEDFKYLRALTAMYIRLTCKAVEVYQLLEPLLADYRQLRVRAADGSFHITTMDQLIDDLLRLRDVCHVALPHLPTRLVLEAEEVLDGPRASAVLSEL